MYHVSMTENLAFARDLMNCVLTLYWWNIIKCHYHYHLSLKREGRRGTTDDFTTSFLHLSMFSTTLRDLANSRPVHSLMLSSHLFLWLPCLLPPFTMSCKKVLARPDERATCPYHCSLRHMVSHVQGTTWRSPSLSRSNTWPLSWVHRGSPSAHLTLVFEVWKYPPSDAVFTPAISSITGWLVEGGNVLFLPVEGSVSIF